MEQVYLACVPPGGAKFRFYEEEGGEANPDFLETLHTAGHFVDFINRETANQEASDSSETLRSSTPNAVTMSSQRRTKTIQKRLPTRALDHLRSTGTARSRG